ncbi:protein kinase domain-containing protein [Citrus sinensis]|nr:protein kinase domain-containing protein [Citrus sinensis]
MLAVIVENGSHDQSTTDLNDTLACHLSYTNLQSADGTSSMSIRTNEIEGFIDGSHICPLRVLINLGQDQTIVTTSNPEYQVWKKHDHILLSWLLSSLSEEVLGTVVDCSTSFEVWTTLSNQFGARTRARILHLRTQIQTTKKGSLTIHEYYSRMKSILNALRAVGSNMSDDDFIMCVFAGLGSEYDSIVASINSMQESPSHSEVYGMLLSQENRIEHNLSSGTIEANYAQMRNGRRNWNKHDGARNQHQPGIVFRTPGNGSGSGQGNQNPQDKGKGKAVANDDGSVLKGPCRKRESRGAYMAATDGQNSGVWYLDNGATNHVTNALGNININSEYQVTQSAADQSHSLETSETSEQSLNLDQGKTQQNLSIDMILDNQLPSPHSNHQLQSNDQPLSPATVPNTKGVVPSHPMVTRSKAGIFKPKLYQISTQPQTTLPSNASEALKEPSWKKSERKSRWNHKQYKAKLVVKGFLQIPGIDFTETFSQVVKAATIRIIFTLAVNNDWMLRTKYEIVILLIYVDDIIITGDNSNNIEELVSYLNKAFALKDLGELNFFLGIQVNRNQNSIMLSQTNLQYAVLTRPELTYSVNKLSQFMSDPRQPYWIACKRVLRYLKNTMNTCLKFKKSEYFYLVAYTYANWANDLDDRRAMSLCTTELTWIGSLLSELKIEMKRTPTILSDSTSAAAIATNPIFHSKTKHFEIDLHFVRDKVARSELETYILLGTRHGIAFFKDQSPKTSEEIERLRRVPYAEAVGNLIYVMLCTRPDICFMWVILILTLYSTTEAEYVAASEAAKEVVWLRKFLQDLEVVPALTAPLKLFYDNSGVVAQSKEPMNHKKQKHIESKYHLIRDIVQRGDGEVTQIESQQNLADPFTKAMPGKPFNLQLESTGMPIVAAAANISRDQDALLSVKAHMINDNPNNILAQNWTSNASVCSWMGITCDVYGNRVTSLTISDLGLAGTIPSHLGNLSSLQTLVLSRNWFSGTIPKEIGNLTKLKELHLDYNKLQGEIPEELGNLAELEMLVLNNNLLTGTIPASIFNLSFISTALDFSDNSLTGSFPYDMCPGLPRLKGLYVSYNQFKGPIPNNLWHCKELSSVSLSYNQFTGRLPRDLGNSTKLKSLDLGFNNLNGTTYSEALGHLRNLKRLGLERNYLTFSTSELMSLFSALVNCKSLKVIALAENPVDGVLPSSIGNLSVSVEEIYMYKCNIHGRIPKEIGNLINLTTLSLGDNNLSGSLPITLGRLKKLQGLDLQNNKFEGPIPQEFCHFSRLYVVYLNRNKLSGSIPSCLGDLNSLRILSLSSNELTSVIPSTFWNLEDILGFDFSSNSLNGSLPLEIENLKAVVDIYLSRNNLSGNIPSTIIGLKNLQHLSLEHNKLQGPIPESFGELVSLEFLDLSNNDLSGVIPASLEKLLYLKSLNLSFNKLVGEIPRGGAFANFSAESFIGNDLLCGSPYLHVPLCKSSPHKKSRKQVILLGVVLPLSTVFIVTVILVLTFGLITRCCKRRSTEVSHIKAGMSPQVMWRRYSHDELLRATDQFSEENLIGIGSYGSVYKGRFPDGIEVAIKRLGIMIDVASALEYLHFGHSNPIVHCDIKPSNVLLDDSMVAHLSDFGIAKLLSEEDSMKQTQTLATIGYIAPEYGREGQVSIKGDVYNYGIMLMEVFTGMKPTNEFFTGEMSIKRWINDSLPAVMNIMDTNLLSEDEEHANVAKQSCASSVLSLAMECTSESPENRVNTKEIISRLIKIRDLLFANIEMV